MVSEPDAVLEKLLSDPTATEARAWLGREDGSLRTLGESDSAQRSKDLVDRLYVAGSVRVVATQISSREQEDLEGVTHHENTGHLVVVLPGEVAKRKRLFRLQGVAARGAGYEGDEDVGQHYLYFKLD